MTPLARRSFNEVSLTGSYQSQYSEAILLLINHSCSSPSCLQYFPMWAVFQYLMFFSLRVTVLAGFQPRGLTGLVPSAVGRLHTWTWQCDIISKGLPGKRSIHVRILGLGFWSARGGAVTPFDRWECGGPASCLSSSQELAALSAHGSLAILVCFLSPKWKRQLRGFRIYFPQVFHLSLLLFFHFYIKKHTDWQWFLFGPQWQLVALTDPRAVIHVACVTVGSLGCHLNWEMQLW